MTLTNVIDEERKLKLNGKKREELFRKLLDFYNTFSIIGDEYTVNEGMLKDILFLKNSFVNNYISKIESFIVPHWYTACFMSQCNNSSLWGYYGENHKGSCLIFDLGEKSNHIKVKQKSGLMISEGACVDKCSWFDMEFLKVDYEKKLYQLIF